MSTVNRLYIDSMSTLYRLFLGTEVFGNIHGPEILIHVLTPGPPMAIFLSCGHPSAVLPWAAKGCQGLSCQGLSCQGLPRAAKGCQGLPRAAKVAPPRGCCQGGRCQWGRRQGGGESLRQRRDSTGLGTAG
jgi:hypothetical protein